MFVSSLVFIFIVEICLPCFNLFHTLQYPYFITHVQVDQNMLHIGAGMLKKMTNKAVMVNTLHVMLPNLVSWSMCASFLACIRTYPYCCYLASHLSDMQYVADDYNTACSNDDIHPHTPSV